MSGIPGDGPGRVARPDAIVVAGHRGVILAPHGGRIEMEHLFSALGDARPAEFAINRDGELTPSAPESCKELCEAVLNSTLNLDQVEALLLQSAVEKARGNLSSAARMLGITRPQLAYRLKRMQEAAPSVGVVGEA